MEFFHEPKIDWMGKKWYFIGISIPVLVVGLISIAVHRGLTYGMDFGGGRVVTENLAQLPGLAAIAHGLTNQNLGVAGVKQVAVASTDELIIGLDLRST